MKLVLLAILTLALSPVTASAEPHASVDFDAPATLDGQGDVGSLHALAIVSPSGSSIQLAAATFDVVREEMVVIHEEEYLDVGWGDTVRRDPVGDGGAGVLQLSTGPAFGALVNGAICDDFVMSGGRVDGLVTRQTGFQSFYDNLPFPAFRGDLDRMVNDVAMRADGLVLPSECRHMVLDLYDVAGSLEQSSGVATIEAGPADIGPDLGGSGPAGYVYYRMVMQDVRVLQWENASLRSGFASMPTINWTGDAYLPRGTATQMPNGAAVDEEGALVLRGNFTLADFGSDGDRMTAAIEGDPELWLDGAPVPVAQDAKVVEAAAVGIVALAIGLLVKYAYGAALFTRLPADEALKHPRRQALTAYIEEHPGATFRELVRETGVPAGTCRHHLSVLQRAEVIVERKHRSTVRFFENHGKYDHDWEAVVMLREPDLAQVYDFIEQNPGAMQKAILQHAQAEWGWSRSTTQHRLQRLVDAGVVNFTEIGRRKEYSLPRATRSPWSAT